MSLKGAYPFAGGAVIIPEAYAVIDQVHIDKGGNSMIHVSIYATPPKQVERPLTRLNTETQVIEEYSVTDIERGPIVEHFSCAGIKIVGDDPFVSAYTQIQKVLSDGGDTRFKDMKSA